MPSIMVYTEETFYYTDGIRVVAREEYMRPDVTVGWARGSEQG